MSHDKELHERLRAVECKFDRAMEIVSGNAELAAEYRRRATELSVTVDWNGPDYYVIPQKFLKQHIDWLRDRAAALDDAARKDVVCSTCNGVGFRNVMSESTERNVSRTIHSIPCPTCQGAKDGKER